MASGISSKIIGIDLGTTNSVVSVMEGGKPTVITNAEGSRITPSVVGFTDKGERLVGQPAKRQAVTNPKNTVYSIKRFMGRRHAEVDAEEKLVPYKVVGGREEPVKVEARGKTYTPPEVSAMILQSLKATAEAYLGQTVERAVITVPAYFNDAQRQATKDAGAIAGLKVERIINEPTAAALAYGLDKKKNEKIVVFDLGGGTFDVSVLDVGDGVFEVLATNGDTHLGGDDFDQRVLNHIADEFKKDQGIDLRKDVMALQRLREAAEKAKCELSTATTTEVNLPFITADASGPKHLILTLTRAQLEQMSAELIERCRKPCLKALEDAKLKPSDINEVVMVGGSTRMPKVQELAKELFGREPNRSVNPDEVVAIGAAIQGAVLTKEVSDILLLDVTPLSLGIETKGNVMAVMIERNTTIPTSKKQVFTTAADDQPSVDIRIFQGERPMTTDNRLLGEFQLSGIPAAPMGTPQIEVAFDIDANGILNVSAKDLGTGKTQSIVIKSSSGLSEAEVKKMQKDAEENAEKDKAKKRLIDARNKAEGDIYRTEKTLKEHKDKIGEDDRKAVEAALEALKKAKDGEDPDHIEKAVETLHEASHKIAQILYEATKKEGKAAEAGGAPPPAEGKKKDGGDDDVVDAEFEKK